MAHEIRTLEGKRNVVYSKTSTVTIHRPNGYYSDCAGSSATYTPTSGADYVVYEYTLFLSDDDDYNHGIFKFNL